MALDLTAPEVQEAIEKAAAEKAAQDVAGLKQNRDELLKEAKAAKAKLAAYEGFDPEEFKRLRAAAEEAERKKAAAEGDFKAIEKQMVEKHGKELEAERARTAKALRALEKRKVAKLTEALSKAGVLPDMMDLMVLRGQDAIRLREADDDWDEFVADEKGNPLVADGKGTPMDVGTFVEQHLKAKYPRAFGGTGSSGSGAPSNGSGGAAPGVLVINPNDPAAMGSLSDTQLREIREGKLKVEYR